MTWVYWSSMVINNTLWHIFVIWNIMITDKIKIEILLHLLSFDVLEVTGFNWNLFTVRTRVDESVNFCCKYSSHKHFWTFFTNNFSIMMQLIYQLYYYIGQYKVNTQFRYAIAVLTVDATDCLLHSKLLTYLPS